MGGRKFGWTGIAIAAAIQTGCATVPAGGVTGPPLALIAANGSIVGSVQMGRDGSATIAASALAPGEHGLHLHDKGLCEGPAFTSAGAHWNPGARQHGRDNPMGAHAGDLPNLFVDIAGKGALRVMLQPGFADADGTALVVHAKADDYKTDPTGASGDRVACAVISPPQR